MKIFLLTSFITLCVDGPFVTCLFTIIHFLQLFTPLLSCLQLFTLLLSCSQLFTLPVEFVWWSNPCLDVVSYPPGIGFEPLYGVSLISAEGTGALSYPWCLVTHHVGLYENKIIVIEFTFL